MYKSKLQELCHQSFWDLPEYVTVKTGPDHCPKFVTTCTVRGIRFESPPNEGTSSKEAQNLAAKIAFDHLSALPPTTMPPSSPSPSSLPPPGFLFSSSKNLDGKPSEVEASLPKSSQTPLLNGAPKCGDEMAKSTLHLYKTRLQNYTQKKTLPLPEYSFEHDGPPHARRFRATVTVEGRAYQTPEYFTTLREAECAAAKVAIESLSEDAIQQDESMYKSLLQEFTQKGGMSLPSYSTERTGTAHRPAFKSTVKIGGWAFCGAECRTKKLAEMNAAKVAFNSLRERRTTDTSVISNTESNPGIGSGSLKPIVNTGLPSTIGACNSLEPQAQVVFGERGTLHIYKSRLQQYMQKKNPSCPPEYSYEHDGPPHARRFKATVKVEGRAYQTAEYFTTLREAECAAAKLAFESLAEDAIQEDESLYKSLLQEFAQKGGMSLPSYSTERTGPPHRPAFKSKVEIGGQTFCGAVCRTKKLAETNAAKVAFNGLTACKTSDSSAGRNTGGNSETGAGSMQPNISTSFPSTMGASNSLETQVQLTCGETGEILTNNHPTSPVNCKHEAVEVSNVCDNSVLSCESRVDMRPKSGLESYENDGDVTVSDSASSDAKKAGGGCDKPHQRILIYPRESNVTIPEGTCMLPCSNDKWLVLSQGVNQDC